MIPDDVLDVAVMEARRQWLTTTRNDPATPLDDIMSEVVKAALTALEAEGWKVVAREPTEAMLNGAFAAIDENAEDSQITECWRGAWDAAPGVEGGGATAEQPAPSSAIVDFLAELTGRTAALARLTGHHRIADNLHEDWERFVGRREPVLPPLKAPDPTPKKREGEWRGRDGLLIAPTGHAWVVQKVNDSGVRSIIHAIDTHVRHREAQALREAAESLRATAAKPELKDDYSWCRGLRFSADRLWARADKLEKGE